MADPYNHNPFSTDDGDRELRSEYAANKALSKTIANQLNKLLPELAFEARVKSANQDAEIAADLDRMEALDYDPWNEWRNNNV